MKMQRVLSVFMCMILFMGGCSSSSYGEESEQVISELEEAGYTELTDLNRDHLFEQKLLNVNPIVYVKGEPQMTFYPIQSPEERQEALNEFDEKADAYNIVDYTVYEDDSHLYFFVHFDEVLPLSGLTEIR